MATLTNEEMQFIALLEQQTGAAAHDVMVGPESITFLVKAGDAGKAIGKGGANIRKLQRVFNKTVDVVEDSDTLEGFVRNLLSPAVVKQITQSGNDGKVSVHVTVEPEKKGLAIGKGGERIRRARALAKRRFNVDELKIL